MQRRKGTSSDEEPGTILGRAQPEEHSGGQEDHTADHREQGRQAHSDRSRLHQIEDQTEKTNPNQPMVNLLHLHSQQVGEGVGLHLVGGR